MQVRKNTNIQHIIAKLDNDFNIDNTDYVPRVAAWVIEALGILKCIPIEKKTKKIEIKDRIGYLPCDFDASNIKVYDTNDCEVTKLSKVNSCCKYPSTGEQQESYAKEISKTLYRQNDEGQSEAIAIAIATGINDDGAIVHITDSIDLNSNNNGHSYLLLPNNEIELTFDTSYITIEYDGIKTEKCAEYNCELPVVPNNALVIEAVTYYCMYKILCRGIKHPVFNLAASQYGTNPFYLWNNLKEQAKRSNLLDAQGNILEEDGDLWCSAFALFAFD